METKWKRQDSVPFPSVWRKFQGKIEENGQRRKYWIQDVPLDLMETVANYMCTIFQKDEVLCKYSKAIEDKESIEEARKYYTNYLLPQRLALICFTEDNNGVQQIAGMNMTVRVSKDDVKFQLPGRALNCIQGSTKIVKEMKNIFENFKVDHYLGGMGLLVLPEYRGDGIAVELLHARKELCLAVGISLTATVFTSTVSQKLAAKAGFKNFTEIAFEDLEKYDSSYKFPGISSEAKLLKFMYLKYE